MLKDCRKAAQIGLCLQLLAVAVCWWEPESWNAYVWYQALWPVTLAFGGCTVFFVLVHFIELWQYFAKPLVDANSEESWSKRAFTHGVARFKAVATIASVAAFLATVLVIVAPRPPHGDPELLARLIDLHCFDTNLETLNGVDVADLDIGEKERLCRQEIHMIRRALPGVEIDMWPSYDYKRQRFEKWDTTRFYVISGLSVPIGFLLLLSSCKKTLSKLFDG